MNKHKKLKLDALKVNSFITNMNHIQGGGATGTNAVINDDYNTSIPTKDTPIYTSTGVSTPQLTETRFTFANPNGGCQATGI